MLIGDLCYLEGKQLSTLLNNLETAQRNSRKKRIEKDKIRRAQERILLGVATIIARDDNATYQKYLKKYEFELTKKPPPLHPLMKKGDLK
jgi:hypothetical protein